MLPDEHRMLVEIKATVEENNQILRSLQRTNRASLAFKVLYWVVILGASFGAYYLIQPYVDAVKGSISEVQNDPTTVAEPYTFSGAVKNLKEILE